MSDTDVDIDSRLLTEHWWLYAKDVSAAESARPWIFHVFRKHPQPETKVWTNIILLCKLYTGTLWKAAKKDTNSNPCVRWQSSSATVFLMSTDPFYYILSANCLFGMLTYVVNDAVALSVMLSLIVMPHCHVRLMLGSLFKVGNVKRGGHLCSPLFSCIFLIKRHIQFRQGMKIVFFFSDEPNTTTEYISI